MRPPPLQHFFTMAAAWGVAGCAARHAPERAVPVVDVAPPATSASAAPPPARRVARAACLPSDLVERGTVDHVAVDAQGDLTLCVAHDGARACLVMSQKGGFAWPDAEPPPRARAPFGPDEEPLRKVGRRTAMRSCVAADVCTLSLVDLDGSAPTVHIPGLYAQSPALIADVAGDRFAFLDVAGTLRFLSAESGQEDGAIHVDGATAGAALVSLAPGAAAIVASAPRAGTVVRVDLRRAEVGLSSAPPACP